MMSEHILQMRKDGENSKSINETEKTWEKAINLEKGKKQERKGLSDFTQSMQ